MEERRSERTPQPPINDLINLTNIHCQELLDLLNTSPSEFKDNYDSLIDLAKKTKVARDAYVASSRNLTQRFSKIGSTEESHQYRQKRSQITSDVFEQIEDINTLIKDLKEIEISNTEILSQATESVSVHNEDSFSEISQQQSSHSKTLQWISDPRNEGVEVPPVSLPQNPPPVSLPQNLPPVSLPQNPSLVSLPQNPPPVSLPQNPPPVSLPQNPSPASLPQNSTPVSMPQYLPPVSLPQYHPPRMSLPQNPPLVNLHQNLPPVNRLHNPSHANVFRQHFPANVDQNGNSVNWLQSPQTSTPSACPFFDYQQQQAPHVLMNPNSNVDPLAQYLLKQDLLKNTIEPFDGTAYKFNSWTNQIRTRIQGLNMSPQEILHVLLSNTTGEPKKMIQEVLSMNVFIDHQTVNDVWTMLVDRHGSPYRAAEQLREKIMKFPTIRGSRTEIGTPLQKFYDLCRVVASYMRNCPHLDDLNNPAGQAIIRSKLPDQVLERWQIVGHAYQDTEHRNPTFNVFVDFLKSISREYSNRNFDRPLQFATETYQHKKNARVLYTKNQTNQEHSEDNLGSKVDICSIHPNSKHTLADCKAFSRLPFPEKISLAKKEGRCFVCLGQHLRVNCKIKIACNICKNQHCTAMHKNVSKNDNSSSNNSEETSVIEPKPTQVLKTGMHNVKRSFKSCSKTFEVVLTMDGVPDKFLSCLAIVDEQSTSSFADPKVVSLFGKEFPHVTYSLVTMNGYQCDMTGCRISGLNVRGKGEKSVFNLPNLLTSPHIPNTKDEIASPAIVSAHKHIAHLTDHFVVPNTDLDVLILIGRDCGSLMKTQCYGIKPPFAHKTPLGWSLVGEISSDPSSFSGMKCLKTGLVCENEHFNALLKFENNLSKPLAEESPFFTRPDDDLDGYSQEDRAFLQLMKDNVQTTSDGFIQLPLPFRKTDLLPNNKACVFTRTRNTLNNLKRNPEKLQACVSSMEKSLKQKHVEEIPHSTSKHDPENAWWLPVFAVEHKQKKKPRLVFDASAQYKKISLNNCLMSGPDLNNQLRGVLLRFRENPIAIVADIEGMFGAFRVPQDQVDYLRFFWFSKNDPNQELTEYRALYHIFGASSSPAVANFALKYTTFTEEAKEYPNALQMIRNCFYVDDSVFSVNDVTEAIKTLKEAKELLAKFNIRLHKIMSNSAEVLAAFPGSELADVSISLCVDEMQPTRTLGVKWNIANDTFTVEVNTNNKQFTKRGVLATVNSVYDPNGIVCPVTLTGKLIQRKLLNHSGEDFTNEEKSSSWDAPLPEEYRTEWQQWKLSLEYLKQIHIPRCFVLPGKTVERQELHIYCDASDAAVGYVAYIRSIYTDGDVSVGFVFANSKVSPKNITSIPRLELCAAVEAATASNWIETELNHSISRTDLYTDSLITLGYINNKTRRFAKYVARRVGMICNHTSPEQWHYVSTKRNPADIASRPQTPGNLSETIWFSGPPELKSIHYSPEPVVQLENLPDVEEERTVLKTQVCEKVEESPLRKMVTGARSLMALIATMKLVMRMRHFSDRARQSKGCSLAPRPLIVSDDDALLTCTRLVQEESYSGQMAILKSGKSLPDSDPISDLSPFVDLHGVLRVGGRISKGRFPFSAKHPALLPANHHLSDLVVSHYHARAGHQGRKLTHGAIRRSGFHILNGRRLIRNFLKNCVLCRKLRGPRMTQRMADLPADRLDQVPPFTHSGVDVFGPFYIHDGTTTRRRNSSKKVWVVIFCCAASRAVHCELLNGMDTSSFINSFRRFLSIRGTCRTLRSDNGTNFICARKQFESIDVNAVQRDLKMRDCVWKLNPPGASHFGGFYERKIGSIRRVLEKTLLLARERGLSRDEFCTLIYETSSIVNQTPLTEISDHPDDPAPITPHQLLTLKEDSSATDLEEYQSSDLLHYGKSRWRRVQYLSNQFWKQWREDYVYDLKKRHKWKREQPCLAVNDIVLVSEKNSPRNYWPIGKVSSVKKSSDNLVRSAEIKLASNKSISRCINDLILLVPSSEHKCLLVK